MTTAPELFDYAASTEERVRPTEIQISRGFDLLGRMLSYGAVGAVVAIAGIAGVAYANARLSDEAFVRLASWF